MNVDDRAVWVDANNDPRSDLRTKYAISWAFFDPRDSRVTAAYLTAQEERCKLDGCGIYVAWNWFDPLLSPAALADKASRYVRRIAWTGNPPVCFDIEKGGKPPLDNETWWPYLMDTMREWRKLRPTRQTFVTIEGMQGGLIPRADVTVLAGMRIRVAPSMYRGDMTPLAHDVTQDLLLAGFGANDVVGMYDAAALPYRWRGFAFTQGRLT